MRKSIFTVLFLLPVFLAGQTYELGPFVFIDESQAKLYAGELGIGAGGVGLGFVAETPTPKFMQFLNFIPGVAARYSVATGSSYYLYVEGLVLSRARYEPRPRIWGFVGAGPAIGIGRIGPTLSVVMGADFMVKDKYMITVTARSTGIFAIGFGGRTGY
jgi:hypothetical protein